MLRLSLISMLLLALQACSDFDAERMFLSHASPVANGELRDLRAGKVSCLHCPLYFAFDAEPTLVAKIIAQQQLRQVLKPSQEVRQVLELVQRHASWSQLGSLETQDKVYWVRYEPTQPALELAFRLLVVKNKMAFFITSGHFDRAQYAEGDA